MTLERNDAILQKNEAEKSAMLAREQKDTVVDLIRRIRIGISQDAGITAMKKICNEAISVTSLLASTDSEQAFADNEQRFLELYFGSMNLVEIRQRTYAYLGDSNQIVISPIETAMVIYKRKLDSQ
ncbi:MAG: hypothetical protein AB8B87_09300 [Granulosicoccus sp.]